MTASTRLRNRAKERLKAGHAICGFGITMASPALAQILAASGADFINVDLEHGSVDLSSAHAIIAATANSDCTPVVRVPTTQSDLIKPVLDAGSLGIIFPMVKSGAEVAAGIARTLYPPAGRRGIGPHYAPARWGMPAAEYLQDANDALLTMILVETREALDDLDAILAVPGLDVVTIAPGDLGASLGIPADPRHPEFQDAIRMIEDKVLKSHKALGGVALSVEDARLKRDRGYRVLVLGFDAGLIGNFTTQMVDAAMR